MTTPCYPKGCPAGSQVCGDAGSARSFFIVSTNNGNVNNNNANNRFRVRPCRVGGPVPSGECQGKATMRALYRALQAARRHKRPSANQLRFEVRWADNLIALERAINAGRWSPAPTTCFIAQRPKARQIHAPDFADRVVHHWLVPRLEAVYEKQFVHDSYANRKGKGTHAAVRRLQQFVRQVHSGQDGGWYLQLDVHNFFNSIHRPTLWRMLKERLVRMGVDPTAIRVTHALLRHPVNRQGVIHRSTAVERSLVPAHKRLENASPGCGLPIGNLSSQFFANVYLDALDQFVKHTLKAKRYLRYVDDFVLVHRDRAVLERWLVQIESFLKVTLRLKLKADIRLRPLSAGIDFLGYVLYPTHNRVRSRVLRHANAALASWQQRHVRGSEAVGTPEDFRRLDSVWASYQGHMQHANTWRLQQLFQRRLPWLPPLACRRRRFSRHLEGRSLRIPIRK